MTMKLLVYPQGIIPQLELEHNFTPCSLDANCQKCPLNDGRVKSPCMPAFSADYGKEGSKLLVVSDYPGRVEDARNEPMTGRTGVYLRPLLRRNWPGPIYIDNAIRCAPGEKVVHPDWVGACRPYLASVISELMPARVLALGKEAILSITGRSLPTMSVRRGYCFMSTRTPVFMFPNPVNAVGNRFLREGFEDDLEWALTCELKVPPFDSEAWIIRNVADAQEAAKELRSAVWMSIDAEWSGVPYRVVELLSVACVPRGVNHAWVWGREVLKDAEISKVLKGLLEDSQVRKVGQNIKSDCHAIWCALGARIEGIVYDARLMRKVLDPEADAKLEKMAELVGMGGHKEEATRELVKACKCISTLVEKKAAESYGVEQSMTPRAREKVRFAEEHLDRAVAEDLRASDDPKSFAFALIDSEVLMRYNAADAIATDLLVDLLESELAENDAGHYVWSELVKPTIEPVVDVERWGMAVSKDAIMSYQAMLNMKLGTVKSHIFKYAGPDFNPDSPKQVGELLYKKMGLEPAFNTPTGAPSTDEEALGLLRDKLSDAAQIAVVDALLEWRHWTKQRNTYAAGSSGSDGMLAHVRGDGRIHTTLNVDGARSGRTSSSDPNLQNITTGEREMYDKDLAKMAREVFVASPSRVLPPIPEWVQDLFGMPPIQDDGVVAQRDFSIISADYSQLELRVACMLCGDPEMKAIFDSGVDYHLRTAQMLSKIIWGIEPDQVEKSHRKACKAINFGLLYGQHDKQLAQKIGCDVEMAKRIRAAVLGKFKVLDAWIRERLWYAQRYGGAWTQWNGRDARWRPLWRIGDDRDKNAKGSAERSAWNTPVQGTASEFCVQSLLKLVRWVRENKLEEYVKITLPVHDSIMADARSEIAHPVAQRIHAVMKGWKTPFNVPLEVDVEIGRSWGSLEKIDISTTKN